jgi:SAP domain/Protein of unknown function (DUF669)
VARFKFDVRGVEGRGSTLPAGVYDAQITSADITKPDGKDERIELVAEIINNKDHNGKKLYEYVNLESEAARWKLLELLEAVGVEDKHGTLDTDRQMKGKKIGVKTFVRPADDVRGFDEQSRIRRMFALDGANDAPVEDLSEEVEAEEAEDEGDEITYEEVARASRSELKGLNTEFELGIKVLRSMSDDDLRAAVMQGLELTAPDGGVEVEEPEEEEPEEEEVEDGGTLSWTDLQGMDRSALKKLNGDQQLGVRVVKSMTDDDLREAVAEALEIEVPSKEEPEEEAEEAEGEEAEASTPADDYDEWSDDDLREELGDRNLPQKGPKGVLIRRLRKDDAQEDKPF